MLNYTFKIFKKTLKFVFLLFILLFISLLVWIYFGKVSLTSGGVYQYLSLPYFDGKYVNFKVWYGQTADESGDLSLGFHGPIVEKGEGGYKAAWYCQDNVVEKAADGDSLVVDCNGEQYDFKFDAPVTPQEFVFPAQQNIAVISDLHGNYQYFVNWAKQSGIIDDNNNWKWGEGHLVILGDTVDKGRDIYQLEWMLYKLEKQARAAGGKVHLMIGNHEQYVLTGNFSRTEPEYLYATTQMKSFDSVYDDTVIGEWLKTKPVIIKIGKILFVHGGISQDVVDKDVGIEQLNELNVRYLDDPSNLAPWEKDIVFSPSGVTKYRGYIRASGDQPKATQGEVDRVLKHFDAETIVVGHTNVDELHPRFDGKVYVVENTKTTPQTLFFKSGRPVVQSSSFIKEEFSNKESRITRDFSYGNMSDISMLFGTVKGVFQLWINTRN